MKSIFSILSLVEQNEIENLKIIDLKTLFYELLIHYTIWTGFQLKYKVLLGPSFSFVM